MRHEIEAELSAGAESGMATGTRVALLTDESPALADAVQQTQQSLGAAGCQVAVLPHRLWREASIDVLLSVVVVYAAHPAAAGELCRQLKDDDGEVAVLAVLPLADNGPDSGAIWRALRGAGADAVLRLDSHVAEVEAAVDLLARFASRQLELATVREELDRVSQFDSVTRLFNRRSFFRAGHRECSRARRYHHALSCLMIDIDYLEHFNKTFGYGCGDYLLSAIAGALRETTRDTDIAARFSDKKMVLLLPETDLPGAATARAKLQQTVASASFEWRQQRLPVSISVGEAARRWHDSGYAPYNTPTVDDEDQVVSVRVELAELLEEADAALSVARKGAHCPDIFRGNELPTEAT